MTDTDRLGQLALELEAIRRREGELRPVRIAAEAEKAKLSKADILAQASRAFSVPKSPIGDWDDTVSQFIGAMCCRHNISRVLEYSGTPQLLSAHVIDTSVSLKIRVTATDAAFCELLTFVLRDSDSVILGELDNSPVKTPYDVAIVHSQLGLKIPRNANSDGFGGEAIRQILPLIHENGSIYWLTCSFPKLFSKAKETLGFLKQSDYHPHAIVDLAPGLTMGTRIQASLLVLRRNRPLKRFVGILRDAESGNRMADAFNNGPAKKPGTCWEWVDQQDARTYGDIEHARALKAMAPSGPCHTVLLGDLLEDTRLQTADAPPDDGKPPPNLYIPQFHNRLATSRMEDLDVSEKYVYGMTVDSAKVNPRFLVQLLNSPYGKHLRLGYARGIAVKSLSRSRVLGLELPLPTRSIQNRIDAIITDLGLLNAELGDFQSTIQKDWSTVDSVVKKVDALKAVLDVDRQVKDWSYQLPYPLATVYRDYRVRSLPTEKFDTLIHFFEMAAVYLAVMGLSYTKALRVNYQTSIREWLHPRKHSAGIKRPDFGFWIGVARASFKELRRIESSPRLRNEALQRAGPELLETASIVGRLTKATEALATPNEYRNKWKGHGGHIKNDHAKRLVKELQPSIREFYESSASTFKTIKLIRVSKAEFGDSETTFEIEELSGSDPRFKQRRVFFDEYPTGNRIAFWLTDSRKMCSVLPFFRLGAPTQPEETCVYVFNRVERDRIRWVSYQEAREPEFRTHDDAWTQSLSRYVLI